MQNNKTKMIKRIAGKNILIVYCLSVFCIYCSPAKKSPHSQIAPALIPYPDFIHISGNPVSLKDFKTIHLSDEAMRKDAELLQDFLSERRLNTAINRSGSNLLKSIELQLSDVKNPQGYELKISKTNISVKASSPAGIFYGMQTFKQLINNKNFIIQADIKDQPAFAIRGYMIDVGRNYQSIPLIKQQIEVMANYKLNVLHFHATEDVAWRFESKRYPQLTQAKNMTRNKGKFYSVAEIKELMQYCKDRYITFIPEIDMPGHSASFTRAMGFDMQSEQGLAVIKNILTEFIDAYQPEYLHIGGDEVKIHNQNFLPEVIKLVQSKGVKTLGWSPGGNIDNKTIRQLWMDDKGTIEEGKFGFIDSRHLYLNHMDPFEGVATIFNRQIGNKVRGDSSMLGAILCNWPDRRVENETDALQRNLVYPGMITFAERTWRGGGQKAWVANIGAPGEQREIDFAGFETRLLAHKALHFQGKPFPYVKQSGIVWNLFGPFDNKGDLTKEFKPESIDYFSGDHPHFIQQVGATVVLRHWWYPLIKGAIDSVARENSTWYASRRIWCVKAGFKNFWIGFNNISRSPATDSPPDGEWDDKNSKAWVNGKLIDPPHWARAGKKGDPEIPLVDEGYEYRSSTKIYLEKGWNNVLLKMPIGSFKGKDWQNPVKWMFTFVEVD